MRMVKDNKPSYEISTLEGDYIVKVGETQLDRFGVDDVVASKIYLAIAKILQTRGYELAHKNYE